MKEIIGHMKPDWNFIKIIRTTLGQDYTEVIELQNNYNILINEKEIRLVDTDTGCPVEIINLEKYTKKFLCYWEESDLSQVSFINHFREKNGYDKHERKSIDQLKLHESYHFHNQGHFVMRIR